MNQSLKSQHTRYIWQALVKRSAYASFIYSVLWCVIALSGFSPPMASSTIALLWCIFLAVPAARMMLLINFDRYYDCVNNVTLYCIFSALTIIPSVAWVWLTSVSLLSTSSWEVNLALVFALIGIVAGGVNTFSPLMSQVMIFLSVMLLPLAYVLAYMETNFPPVIAGYCLLYFVGMTIVGRIQNKELKASIGNAVMLQQALYLDPLTGLANRRHLYSLLDTIDQSQPMIAVAIDIDHFKSINDQYGHAAGDECLTRFARLFQSAFEKDTEHCVRMGGEEFLALFLSSKHDEVLLKAAALVEQVREIRFETKSESIQFTISVGAAYGLVDDSASVQNMIDRADKQLYLAKNAGRDRIEVTSSYAPEV